MDQDAKILRGVIRQVSAGLISLKERVVEIEEWIRVFEVQKRNEDYRMSEETDSECDSE